MIFFLIYSCFSLGIKSILQPIRYIGILVNYSLGIPYYGIIDYLVFLIFYQVFLFILYSNAVASLLAT